jgi:phage major head subunit gpT-like protein
MAIAPANWNILVTGVQIGIDAAWSDRADSVYNLICEERPSSTTQEIYPWIGMLPKQRLWNGPRVPFEAAPQTYTITNQTFESTLSIDRFTLDDDQFGVYAYQIPFMAQQAARQPDYMLRDLIENTGDQTGPRQTGQDGVNGFSTAHPINFYNAGQGTYINDFGGGGASVTFNTSNGGISTVTVGGPFSPVSFWSLYNYMAQLKNESGEVFGIKPNYIMHAPFLKGEVELVLRSQYFAPPTWGTLTGQVGAAENPNRRYGIEPIMNSFLANQYTWYMMDTMSGFKPFIHQTREADRMVPRISENDPVVFDNHTFLFGRWNRQAVAFGPPFLFARSGP